MEVYLAGGLTGNLSKFWKSVSMELYIAGTLSSPYVYEKAMVVFLAGEHPVKNGKDGIVYDNMVIDQGDFHSNCEHHCVWFWGKYWFAYIPHPKGKILGISKIGRVVDYCSARLQIQERLVHDIVDMLKKALGSEYPPLGIALVMKGHHSCKEFRGAKKKGIMTSSYLEGAFKDDPQVRAEFMNLVNGDKYEG